MALTDPAGSIQTKVTDRTRELIARSYLGNVSFVTVGFAVGRGGYDPSDPVQSLPVNGADVELSDKVYPTAAPLDYAPCEAPESPVFNVRVYNCRLAANPLPSNADYGLGELGLYGQIIKSDNPSEIGEVFLMAIGHFPIKVKTNRDVFLLRAVVSY